MNLGLFSSAAEAGPHDILKMYTPEGSLVNISNRLESNRPDAPYRLELVAAHFNQGIHFIIIISKKIPAEMWMTSNSKIGHGAGSLPEQLRAELALLEERYS